MKKTVTDGLTVENLKSEDYKFLIEAKIELAENQADNLISRDIVYSLNEMESFLHDIELELILGANQQTDIVDSYPYSITQLLSSNFADVDSMLQDYYESQKALIVQENLMIENYLSLYKLIIAEEIDIVTSDITDSLQRYTSLSKATIEGFGHASPGFFENIWNMVKNNVKWLSDPEHNLLEIISISIQTGVKLITNAIFKDVDINEGNILEKVQEGFEFVQDFESKVKAAPKTTLEEAEEEYSKSEYDFTET